MLASPGTEGELGDTNEWAFEMKWDGIRAIAEVHDGTVRLLSRNGIDITVSYPELETLPQLIDGDAVIDGEIIAINKAGRPNFGVLQTRMKLTKKAEVERAAETTPVHFMAFDLLELRGEHLTDHPWTERRALLESNVRTDAAIQVPPVFEGDAAAAVSTSRTLGLEGIMAKRKSSTYLPGKRSHSWVKLKHNLTQEVVIGGWRPGSGSRAHRVGSLLMGVPDDDGLRYVGRVGSGFTDRDLDALMTKLGRMERATSPFVDIPALDAADAHYVTPKLVGEVEFAEWSRTDKLRQPRWRGWRPDKDAAEVRRES